MACMLLFLGFCISPGADTAFLKAVKINMSSRSKSNFYVKHDGSCFVNLSGTNPQLTKIKHQTIISVKIKEFIPNFYRDRIKLYFPVLEKPLHATAAELFTKIINMPYRSFSAVKKFSNHLYDNFLIFSMNINFSTPPFKFTYIFNYFFYLLV